MNICLKILARLIMIGMPESVADILNVFKKYIQVHSLYGAFILKFPSISMLPFCILFFRLLNNNELRAIPDGAFQNLTDLEYMYVSHLSYFPSFLKYIIIHMTVVQLNKSCKCYKCRLEYNVGGRESRCNFLTRNVFKMNSS